MSKFLHEAANLSAIIQGKLRQAEKMTETLEKNEKTESIHKKISEALVNLDRILVLIREEREQEQKNKNNVS